MEATPVHDSRPNNSVITLSDNHTDRSDLELGFGPSEQLPQAVPPQTTQISTNPIVSLTGYSRSLGSARKQDQPESAGDASTTSNLNGLRRHNSVQSQNHNGNNHSHQAQIVEANLSGKDVFRRPQKTPSPDNYRRSTLNKVPEEMESNERSAAQSLGPQISAGSRPFYGSVGYGSVAAGVGEGTNFGTLSYEEDSELSEEEEEWLLDDELARQGLYRGNYKILLALYTSVPISSLVAFISLAILPILAFPSRINSPFPYPPYLPYPLPEILTATALWSLAYLLRDPLYATSLFLTSLIPFPAYRFPAFIPFLSSVFSAILQSGSTLVLRQLAVPILLVPYYSTERLGTSQPFHSNSIFQTTHAHHFPTWQDGAFRRVWWIALGWALAEAVVGIKQGYENIGLYKDILVDVKKNTTRSVLMVDTRSPRYDQRGQTPSNTRATADIDIMPTQWERESQRGYTPTNGNGEAAAPRSTSRQQDRHHSSSRSPSDANLRHYAADDPRNSRETQPLLVDNHISNHLSRQMTRESDRLMVENEVERDLEELVTLKNREELEEIYGIPVIRIPVFVSCLHRINSILSSLGTTLLLTSAYMRSTLGYVPPSDPRQSVALGTFKPSNKPLLLTFPILLAVHTLLTLMHTPWILPRLGIHTFVYIVLLVSLGLFFGGLGVWEALT